MHTLSGNVDVVNTAAPPSLFRMNALKPSSFQQVKKYEKGMNRMSSSRLWEIGRIVGVDVAYFFEGINDEKNRDRGRNERSIPGHHDNNSCLDFEWRPTLIDIQEFAADFRAKPDLYSKYTLVIAGSGTWSIGVRVAIYCFVV